MSTPFRRLVQWEVEDYLKNITSIVHMHHFHRLDESIDVELFFIYFYQEGLIH